MTEGTKPLNFQRYAVAIQRDGDDHVVSVRDLPEVVTSGDSLDEALALAADAVEVAVAGRIEDDMELPEPSAREAGEHVVDLPAPLATKAVIYAAWKRSGVSKSELGRRLDRNEAEVRRILKPRYGTKIDQLADTAKQLGGRLVISFEPN